MNWFNRSRRSLRSEGKARSMDEELLRYVLQFAESLELPDPDTGLTFRLLGADHLTGRATRQFSVRAPYYLLVYAGDGEQKYLNTGYVLGQLEVLLESRNIQKKVLQQIPDEFQVEKDGRTCIAVLAFGLELKKGRSESVQTDRQHPFICREAGETWTSEVLEHSKEVLMEESQTGVRIIRKKNGIHFAAGKYFGRRADASELQAGIALAGVMAAAEDLWIDLSMVRMSQELQEQEAGPDYLISVCRKKDKQRFRYA